MADSPVLFWFRDDLRLADNPGLAAAHATGKPVVTVYVLDEDSREARPPGGATRWWLDKSLRALAERIVAMLLRSFGPKHARVRAAKAAASACAR